MGLRASPNSDSERECERRRRERRVIERERDREKHKWASIESRMRCEKRAVVARTVMLTAPPMPVPQSRPAPPPTIYLHVTNNKAPFHPAVLLLARVTKQGGNIPPPIEAKPRKRTGIKETKSHVKKKKKKKKKKKSPVKKKKKKKKKKS